MRDVLARWNALPQLEAIREIQPCCGSEIWAAGMAAKRPIDNVGSLSKISDEVWSGLDEAARLEAFRSHPRIGESRAVTSNSQVAEWSAQEQQNSGTADDAAKAALRAGNLEYEKKFGHIFIVCATGKPSAEILAILHRRLDNDQATEFREACEEQRKIIQIRLEKWLAQ